MSCDKSPFEPNGEGERVPVGPVIQDALASDSVKWYSFDASANERFAVFLEALQGHVLLAVYDSLQPSFPGPTLSADAGGPRLDDNATTPFGSGGRAVYRLRFQGFSADSTVRYRFKVYRINQAPEQAPESFSFGDTVAAETIDPMVDLDHFVAHGEAGQQIVTVLETQGASGNSAVYLSVVDRATSHFFGYVTAAASPLTTGRLRLPTTGDYDFRVSSVISNTFPLYRGPYRFWTYVVNPAPEHRPAALPFNTAITGERIDQAGDLDEYTFSAAAGADFVAFVQGGQRTFQLEVAPSGGEAIASTSSAPTDTALFMHGTNRFHIASAGTYVVRVTGSAPNDPADTGSYRTYLHAVDRRPEHVPAALTPGDTVSGEDIGIPGDIDEFTFTGSAGEEYDAFLQAQNGSPDTHLQLEVLNPAGTLIAAAQSVGSDTSLLHQVTGRFALSTSGTFRLRVTGTQAYNDHDRGAYRLFLYRINRKPELVPDTLAFGDSLSGEAIDLPGDVDEFRVRVPDSSGANLAFALDNAPEGGPLTVQLIDSATGQVRATASTYSAGRAAMGRMRLAPGKYIVRVDGSQAYDQSTLRGSYRLWFYRFGFGPEVASDTFAIGDTVSESLEPWQDEDDFHFYGRQGQHINLLAQGVSAPSSGAFQFFLIPPPGAPGYGAFLNTWAGSLTDHQTARIDLPATGWYTVQVTGYGGGFAERGPYRFTVDLLGTGPEQVGTMLSAGDSVTTEKLDFPGDWDEFTGTGTPGQTMSVVLHGRSGYTGPFVPLWVFDPATFDTLAYQVGQFNRIAGPFRVPTSGQLKIAVMQPTPFFRLCYDATCGGLFTLTGSYDFQLIAVNRAPENNPATYTIGDTVRSETISPVGDLDEFTAYATPGEQLTLFDRLLVQSSIDSAIVIEVVDPATGTSIMGGGTAVFGASGFVNVGSFTVPASGMFILRAHVYGEAGFGVGTTAYEFFVKRGP